jgi:hypothetical protein
MYANRFVRLLCQEEASFTIVGYCACPENDFRNS